MKTKLKPCPFCGCAPNVDKWIGNGKRRYSIACRQWDSCGVCPCTVPSATMHEAERRWNKRASDGGRGR